MKILGIEHLGIAVKALANDAPFWKHILNIDQKSTEVIDD
ncbi:MAG: methylmalonyl-CoA epimerase, partial [Candidatus Marinimicrobia bacterium]|nr:methylmalonyl-CoA epimerase [Candidatus Neomarinimicrobiota bacterium]